MKKRILIFSNVNSTITLTFGDCAESHAGMEIRGVRHTNGFSLEELLETQSKLRESCIDSQIFQLECSYEKAYLLIIRNGIDHIFEKYSTSGYRYDDLYREQLSLEPLLDKKL
jgi:hypothetical protein